MNMNMKEVQKQIWQNKINKGFNINDVKYEFCLLYGEVGEAFSAYLKGKDDLGGELADIAIFTMGLAEMLGFELEDEILKKVAINEKRIYKDVNGVPIKVKSMQK